jgi:polar amino acid transport system substrate-binding protein
MKGDDHEENIADRLNGLGLATAITMLFGVAAGLPAAAADLDELKAQGFVRVAIANEPPWAEVKTDGSVTGVAPEVARAVMKKMGVDKLLASISEYGAMIPWVQARRFGMVAAGLFIKPER